MNIEQTTSINDGPAVKNPQHGKMSDEGTRDISESDMSNVVRTEDDLLEWA